MTSTETRTATDLANAMIDDLDKTYELVYVTYDDTLTDEQVGHVVRGDMEALWESLAEWEDETSWDSVEQIIAELKASVIRGWENENDVDYSNLADAFDGSDEWERVRYEIEERNTGDWIKRLVRQTGQVLLRIPIDTIDEDNAFCFQEVEPAEVLDRIGFAHTKDNLSEVSYVLANASPEFSVLMGYWIVGADVEALYDLLIDGDTQQVEITDPYIYLGNPFAGSGFISEKPLTGTVRLPRADLRTDKDAFGYSINDIYGGVHASSFEATIAAITLGSGRSDSPAA